MTTSWCTFTFQSTPPVKAATYKVLELAVADAFQSTPPVKAATFASDIADYILSISIHAAREGGDVLSVLCYEIMTKFQSTPPVKAATCSPVSGIIQVSNISIHAAREGGDHVNKSPLVNGGISIHAAREGGDTLTHWQPMRLDHFNPRRP